RSECAEILAHLEASRAHRCAHSLRRHVRDVGTAGPQACDALPVDVDPCHTEACIRHRHGLGQTDVAEADHGHAGGATLELAFESHRSPTLRSRPPALHSVLSLAATARSMQIVPPAQATTSWRPSAIPRWCPAATALSWWRGQRGPRARASRCTP